MPVFRTSFKIIKKHIPQLMINIVIFLSLAVALSHANNPSTSTDFASTKVPVAFINHDADSRLAEGLQAYLGRNATLVDIPDEKRKLQDALFFRQVEYIVTVPRGFTEELLSGKNPQLERTAVPDSASRIYLDSLIDNYLNTAAAYIGNAGPLSQEQLTDALDRDLAQRVAVEVLNPAPNAALSEGRAFYFNYMAYSLLAILILGVSTVMMVFNQADLKKRNLCAPVSLKSMNGQLILGNLSFALLVWVLLVALSFVLFGRAMGSTGGLLLSLSALVFTVAVLSISYLIGNLLTSKGAMSAVANVVTLGTCFISGVFVPQEYLGKAVLKIASFTPNYWYVKANNGIVNLAGYDWNHLAPIFANMLIEAGFAAAVLLVAAVVTKQKRLS